MSLHDNSCCDPRDSDSEEESDPDDGGVYEDMWHIPAVEVSHFMAQAESEACNKIMRLFSSLSVETRQWLLPKLQRKSQAANPATRGRLGGSRSETAAGLAACPNAPYNSGAAADGAAATGDNLPKTETADAGALPSIIEGVMNDQVSLLGEGREYENRETGVG